MSGHGFLDAAARQASVATDDTHRPWPLPDVPWVQAETREQIALAHWVAPAGELARLLPPELELDRFDGEAWVGAVAFRARNVRVRGLPPLPGLSSLHGLELRTYVTDGTRPGIWLFSFEATARVIAEAVKRSHRLPAYHARIELDASPGGLTVEAERDGRRLSARFVVSGPAAPPAPGSFERFACERYALYTSDGGRLYRAELNFSPWSLAPAEASVEQATLAPVPPAAAVRASLAGPLDLVVWPPEEL